MAIVNVEKATVIGRREKEVVEAPDAKQRLGLSNEQLIEKSVYLEGMKTKLEMIEKPDKG